VLICHEVVHGIDIGDYDFDHPWTPTPGQRRHALAAQLVACLASYAFVATVLHADPGLGQLALARQVVRELALQGPDVIDRAALGERVAAAVAVMCAALDAPPWRRPVTREVAVDRGGGVMCGSRCRPRCG
jgi:hypothetical protein